MGGALKGVGKTFTSFALPVMGEAVGGPFGAMAGGAAAGGLNKALFSEPKQQEVSPLMPQNSMELLKLLMAHGGKPLGSPPELPTA
jgi:hypothetical protein